MDKSEAQMLKESPTNFEETKKELMNEVKIKDSDKTDLIEELKEVPIENLTFGGKGLNLSYSLTNFIMISFFILFFTFHLLILISLKRIIYGKYVMKVSTMTL